MKDKPRPIHEVRLGFVKAAIWKNETDAGPRYNATVSRLYKDKEDEQWKSTESFWRDDSLVLAKVADQAHSWTSAQPRPDNAARPTRPRDHAQRRAASLERSRAFSWAATAKSVLEFAGRL